jgi:Sigma-70, region 4
LAEVDLALAVLSALRQPGERFTLEQIADFCGLSRERVRQIELSALRKLRKKLRKLKLSTSDLVGTPRGAEADEPCAAKGRP